MRTIFALIYDGLIILSLIILLTFPIVILNHGQAVAPGDKRYTIFILTITFVYFWSMTKMSGQTIGMRAWQQYYDCSQTNRLWFGLLVRYCLFLPITILTLFQSQKRERVLNRFSGISKSSRNEIRRYRN